MEILNKEKLIQVLEKWKGHPSITDLMDRFGKLQTYTKKKFKKKVKTVCKSYRISVESSQLSLDSDEFYITMESGRNNFEMFLNE